MWKTFSALSHKQFNLLHKLAQLLCRKRELRVHTSYLNLPKFPLWNLKKKTCPRARIPYIGWYVSHNFGSTPVNGALSRMGNNTSCTSLASLWRLFSSEGNSATRLRNFNLSIWDLLVFAISSKLPWYHPVSLLICGENESGLRWRIMIQRKT